MAKNAFQMAVDMFEQGLQADADNVKLKQGVSNAKMALQGQSREVGSVVAMESLVRLHAIECINTHMWWNLPKGSCISCNRVSEVG